jgi:predicted dehydrogenase
VIVATPDHWHALPTIYACQAGKDVHCEKPISHNIVEGRAMVGAARRHNRIIQVNTWQRSTQHFLDAIEYVRSGKIGKVSVCRAWKVQDPKAATMGDKQPTAPPSELDYDLWVGPAEMIPYQDNRCHYNFRWYFNYAGGMTGDWGVHMIDMVLLGMSRNNNIVMPRRVSSFGGKHYTGPGDDRTTPDTQIAIMEFPGGQPNSSQAVPPTGWLLQWEVHVGSQAAGTGLDGGRDHGSEFIGSEGRVLADRSGWSIFDKDGKPVEKPATQRPALDGMSRHAEEWLECVRGRRQPSSDIRLHAPDHDGLPPGESGLSARWGHRVGRLARGRHERQARHEPDRLSAPVSPPWSLPKV